MKTLENKIHTIAKNQIKFLERQVNRVYNGETIHGDAYYMFLGDIGQLTKFYNLVLNGKYKQAENLSQNMDTNCREFIKDTVFNFVNKDNKWL